MTLRHLIGAIAIGLVMLVSGASVQAGNSQDQASQKKGKRAAALKQGEQTQGTFAYRFNTYSGYTSTTSPCDPLTSTSCTTSLNDDLRSGSGTYFPSVKPTDAKKPANTQQVKKADTPTND